MSRFERARADALRHGPARHDSLRGRWAGWVAWRLDERAQRADATAGHGGRAAIASAPPPRPWRSQPLRERPGYRSEAEDAGGGGWAAAVLVRWAGRAVGVLLLAPGLVVVAAWTVAVPRMGPVRPGRLAAVGAALIAAAVVTGLVAAPASGWLAAWVGVSFVAAAGIARDILGWRPPVTGGRATPGACGDDPSGAPCIQLDPEPEP